MVRDPWETHLLLGVETSCNRKVQLSSKAATHPVGDFVSVGDVDGRHLHGPPRLLVQVVDLTRERQAGETRTQEAGNEDAFKSVPSANRMGLYSSPPL